jgi:cytochrome c oxidase assembly factor CtaG
MIRLLSAALALVASEASAHPAGPPHALAGWTFDLPIALPLAGAVCLYAIGAIRVWRRAGVLRGVDGVHAAAFAAGWLALAGALVTPLHALGEMSFAAHMIEHELMMVVAAPLLVLSRPAFAFLWAMPSAWRGALGSLGRGEPAMLWRTLTHPAVATLLHAAAIWAWHAPRLFEAALADDTLHLLQHASFFGTAILFWWAMLSPTPRRLGASVGHLFFTAMHTGGLGALLVLAPRPLFAAPGVAIPFGLSPLEDQQLAGLLMWTPGGVFYLVAALALAARWIAASDGVERA